MDLEKVLNNFNSSTLKQQLGNETLSHFENGCDVTPYLMLGGTKTLAKLSIREKICAGLQKSVIEMLARIKGLGS